ncbi:MAG: transposase [Candidatus Aegiribacteria sp.]|nr:transposase [Candidatus Aegiribacteria sp.]
MRIEYPGALYHVTARGNGKATIFLDDEGRLKFLDILEDCSKAFKFICHGYCIMSNHYHLLIETPNANLSAGIHRLNSVYAKFFNKQYEHVGHVFQGRFKAILVQRDNYLLELCRYIVLNPVRAGIVDHPANYRWSSYCQTIGATETNPTLTTDWVLAQFDSDISLARKSYINFVMDGINADSPMKDVRAGLVLGDKCFMEALRNRIGKHQDDIYIPKEQRYACREDLPSLFKNLKFLIKESRNKLLFTAYTKHGYTMKELSEFLHLHVITVGRIIREMQISQTIDSQNMSNKST